MNKEQQDFNRKLSNDIPYHWIVSSRQENKDALFKEFLSTEMERDFILYLNDLFPEHEQQQIKETVELCNKVNESSNSSIARHISLADYETKVNALFLDFANIPDSKLDTKYKSHSLKQTKTCKVFNEVLDQIKILSSQISDLNRDLTLDIDRYIKAILRQVKSIDSTQIQKDLLLYLIDNIFDFEITIKPFVFPNESHDSKVINTFEAVKLQIKDAFREYIETLNEPLNEPSKQTIEPKKKARRTMNAEIAHLEYALYYDDLIKHEKLNEQQAKARTVKDLGISLKTVNRALKTHLNSLKKDK